MFEKKFSLMNAYFDEQIALCNRRSEELFADSRGDEAVFEKVRANVFDIFRTVLSAAEKSCKGDAEAAARFFLLKLEQIPSNWVESYEKAKQHNDAAKMRTEEIKLDALRQIKEYFSGLEADE